MKNFLFRWAGSFLKRIFMNKGILYLWTAASLIYILSGCSQPLQNKVSSSEILPYEVESSPIHDSEWLKLFEEKATGFMADNKVTAANTYKEQLSGKTCKINTEELKSISYDGSSFYQTFRKGVLMMGRVYKCGHCPVDHISVASAFVVSKEGICVTNYHVFKSYDPSKPNDYITFFVMDSEQNIYPVIEVLAASKQDDLAVFRIDPGEAELHPLAIGEQKAPGASIHLISHPDHRFYTYTTGQINRHYIKPGTTTIRQSISAEFAKGSSGAPIMDDFGNVVGVVAGTQNIYYDPKGEVYQATIKEIIPVNRIKALME